MIKKLSSWLETERRSLAEDVGKRAKAGMFGCIKMFRFRRPDIAGDMFFAMYCCFVFW